jgi:xanthine dehydrogenase small subunit
MPALIVMGATLVLRKGKKTREMPLDAFYIAYQKTALEPGEFVERIRVPRRQADAHFRTYKISKRFDQDISAVCGAFLAVLKRGRVESARIAYGGMAAIPKRASAAERALIGREWNEGTVRTAMTALADDYAPLTDMRATGGYRKSVARNLLHKFWLETSGNRAATQPPIQK